MWNRSHARTRTHTRVHTRTLVCQQTHREFEGVYSHHQLTHQHADDITGTNNNNKSCNTLMSE